MKQLVLPSRLTLHHRREYPPFRSPDASGAECRNSVVQGAQPPNFAYRAFFMPACLSSYGGRCVGTLRRGRFLDPVYDPIHRPSPLSVVTECDGSNISQGVRHG